MDQLLEKEWIYLINLCGQDFPLKTNGQMVTYLKYHYPRNSIESFQMPEHKLARYTYHFEVGDYDSGEYEKGLKKTTRQKGIVLLKEWKILRN